MLEKLQATLKKEKFIIIDSPKPSSIGFVLQAGTYSNIREYDCTLHLSYSPAVAYNSANTGLEYEFLCGAYASHVPPGYSYASL
jgi:hypothetical protein